MAKKNESSPTRIEVGPSSVQIWGLTPREYVLAALAALDQAGVTPQRFAQAFERGRGKTDQVLDNLDLLAGVAVKYGVWCIDEACFYDPTPREWNDAVDAVAMNCRANRAHAFEVRELPTSET